MILQPTKTDTPKLDDKWFDTFISYLNSVIRTDQLLIETDTASNEIKKFYQAACEQDYDYLAQQNRLVTQKHFVTKIILEFVSIIKNIIPIKLAFDYEDAEVLVWVEIKNDDEETEIELFKAKATINAKYHPLGYDISIMIIQEGDNFPIPNHYKIIK